MLSSSRTTLFRRLLAPLLPKCLTVRECVGEAQSALGVLDSFSLGVPDQISVATAELQVAIKVHGAVHGLERTILVSLKSELNRSNVKVKQLARPAEVLLMFHDLAAGANVERLLDQIRSATGDCGAFDVVLVLMHRDVSVKFPKSSPAGPPKGGSTGLQKLGEKSTAKLQAAVSLVVEMAYNDGSPAIDLRSEQNRQALDRAVEFLSRFAKGTRGEVSLDSFTIAPSGKNCDSLPTPRLGGVPSLRKDSFASTRPAEPPKRQETTCRSADFALSSKGSGKPPVAPVKVHRKHSPTGSSERRTVEVVSQSPTAPATAGRHHRSMTWSGWDWARNLGNSGLKKRLTGNTTSRKPTSARVLRGRQHGNVLGSANSAGNVRLPRHPSNLIKKGKGRGEGRRVARCSKEALSADCANMAGKYGSRLTPSSLFDTGDDNEFFEMEIEWGKTSTK